MNTLIFNYKMNRGVEDDAILEMSCGKHNNIDGEGKFTEFNYTSTPRSGDKQVNVSFHPSAQQGYGLSTQPQNPHNIGSEYNQQTFPGVIGQGARPKMMMDDKANVFNYPCMNDPNMQIGNHETSYIYKSSPNIPKIPSFSGDEQMQKGEVLYKEWRYEVNCLTNDPEMTPGILVQAIRRSLKGTAKSVLIPLGENASVHQILRKLDNLFGEISTNGMIMQQFFNASRNTAESVTSFGCRLETLLQTAIDQGYMDNKAKNELLRHKFWTSLNYPELQAQTRHKYDTIKEYDILLREIRKVEKEINENKPKESAKVREKVQHQPIISDSLQNIEKQLNEKIQQLEKKLQNSIDEKFDKILKRLDTMEVGNKTENIYRLNRGQWYRGQNRGGFRGRGQNRGQGRGITSQVNPNN